MILFEPVLQLQLKESFQNGIVDTREHLLAGPGRVSVVADQPLRVPDPHTVRAPFAAAVCRRERGLVAGWAVRRQAQLRKGKAKWVASLLRSSSAPRDHSAKKKEATNAHDAAKTKAHRREMGFNWNENARLVGR